VGFQEVGSIGCKSIEREVYPISIRAFFRFFISYRSALVKSRNSGIERFFKKFGLTLIGV
jgi:hypothetical protein